MLLGAWLYLSCWIGFAVTPRLWTREPDLFFHSVVTDFIFNDLCDRSRNWIHGRIQQQVQHRISRYASHCSCRMSFGGCLITTKPSYRAPDTTSGRHARKWVITWTFCKIKGCRTLRLVNPWKEGTGSQNLFILFFMYCTEQKVQWHFLHDV